ncbi:hypothetical protein MKY92_25135 [Paenibacillus sp. FSL R5-0623]|uniref:hypothetical protein n=1 Tax=Paenibacillus sp. FSL R5-0623 TaxID=2921651 RepID=UPI0030D97C97
MDEKYLLYIDILGFKELVDSDINRVKDLYQVIASLNVHLHDGFKAIVFSDTILIYNNFSTPDEQTKAYTVMFLCEFVQDLQHRLIGRDITFRAVITYGQFINYEINQIPCFYGTALIDAYLIEKEIPCTGLFITDRCNASNNIFRTQRYSDDLNFVFVTQNLHRLEYEGYSNGWLIDELGLTRYVMAETLHIKFIFENMRNHSNSKVRTKYSATWNLYVNQYPRTLELFEQNSFNLNAIYPEIDWDEWLKLIPEDYSYIQEGG